MPNSKLLAWHVTLDDKSCIVFADTAPKAKWTAVKNYWAAYGRTSYWPACSVARRSFLDTYPGEAGYAYSPQQVGG